MHDKVSPLTLRLKPACIGHVNSAFVTPVTENVCKCVGRWLQAKLQETLYASARAFQYAAMTLLCLSINFLQS